MNPRQSNNKTPKTGLVKEYFRDGQLCSVGRYLDGRKTGVWKYYLRNGGLKAIGKYAKDELTGLWKWYRENGNPLQVGKFKNGRQEGLTPLESFTTWATTRMGKRRGCGSITMRKES